MAGMSAALLDTHLAGRKVALRAPIDMAAAVGSGSRSQILWYMRP